MRIGILGSGLMCAKLGILFTRVFSRIRVTDTHNGLRALSRSAAQSLRIAAHFQFKVRESPRCCISVLNTNTGPTD